MFDTCTAGQNGDELLRKERERDKNRKTDRQKNKYTESRHKRF
jgi:hypothetical protein